MSRRGLQITAVLVGALTYVVGAFLRMHLLQYFHSSDHWLNSVNAFLIYTGTLLSGFIAGLLYRQGVFLTGFCAGGIGEFTHGIIKLLVSLHGAWIEVISLPSGYFIDLIFAVLISGILGAAGAASAVVARQYRATNRGDG